MSSLLGFVRTISLIGLLILGAGVALPDRAIADAIADFYKDRRMEFVIGSGAGSTYDSWARLLSRHIVKHIPGKPTIIPRNMPGGGGIVATNYMFNQAAQDGTVLAIASRNIPLVGILQEDSVRFKTADIKWIGSPQASNRVCVAAAGRDAKKAEDLFSKELLMGGTGAGNATSAAPVLVNKMLGMKFKLIDGYQKAPDVFLAMDRGEVDGYCGGLPIIEDLRHGWIAQGKLNVLFNFEKDPITGVPGIDAPSIYAFTKTDEQRQVIAFFNSSVELGFPVMTTPRIPSERLDALRRAFDRTMHDKDFLEEAKKMKFEVNSRTGEQLFDLVKVLTGMPKPIVDKTIEYVGKLSE
jgi:tripartite-type tricarboxylate transporter receptor subunit TctC